MHESVPGATNQRMIRTGRELLLGLLVCFFFSSVAADCKGCNISKACCEEKYNITGCSNVFRAEVNSSLATIKEGDVVTLECSHNIPALNLSYGWFKDDKSIDGNNKTITFERVLSSRNGKYKCCVKTSCGSCESVAFDFKVENNSIVIMIVCGVSALALVLIMGVAMKVKLQMDKNQHKQRMRQRAEQRAQEAQNAGPIPFARGY